jgi:hypothetical protein
VQDFATVLDARKVVVVLFVKRTREKGRVAAAGMAAGGV